MRIVVILVLLLIGMLLVLSAPIKPEIKTLVNIAMFLVAMWRITICIDAIMKKYQPIPIRSTED